jgi:hypothetical protein
MSASLQGSVTEIVSKNKMFFCQWKVIFLDLLSHRRTLYDSDSIFFWYDSCRNYNLVSFLRGWMNTPWFCENHMFDFSFLQKASDSCHVLRCWSLKTYVFMYDPDLACFNPPTKINTCLGVPWKPTRVPLSW